MPALPGMAHDRPTLEFYEREATAYAVRADGIGVPKHLTKFVDTLPRHAAVLDLGCGTGRDTSALIDAGLDVTAIDGSAEMAREAEKRIGRPVRVQLFEDLDDTNAFDGIWANASLLHVPRAGLPNVLRRVHRALKPSGLLAASFKSGGQEGRDRLSRYYNYLNADEQTTLLNEAGAWQTLKLEEGRGTGYDGSETGWIVVFARKTT